MKATLTILVLVAVIGGGWRLLAPRSAAAQEIPTTALFTARRGTLDITVTENGFLKAENSIELKPKFKNRGTITWLIEEGEEVVEGDVLIEFDKAELETEISEQETSLIQYQIELEAAKAELGIQERDNAAAIEKAELAAELARLDLERYVDGDAPNEQRKMNLAAEKAESEYLRAEERFQQVPDLAAEGFLTKIQVEEERIKLREAEINKENASRELELFETYTLRTETTKRESALADAERELENARIKADINHKEKLARQKQEERRVASTKSRLDVLREELVNMTLLATGPGIVHHGDPDRSWWREQIKVGNTLHAGMTAITLPDLSDMIVEIQVHEADIDLVELEKPVVITIETHKGMTFHGTVTDIASVANSQSWEDETNKTFRVEIKMDSTAEKMRAGVTARAVVQVEELEDVVFVPIHAVFPENGEHFCYVFTDGELERRAVSIGKSNAHYVVLTVGLDEGETVLLYDPREGGLPEGPPGSGDDAEGDGGADGDDIEGPDTAVTTAS